MLNFPQPRSYLDTEQGATPQTAKKLIVGQGVNIKKIVDANVDLKHNMQQEVLCPLEKWLSAYRTIKVRLDEMADDLAHAANPEVKIQNVSAPMSRSKQMKLAKCSSIR